VNAKIQKRKSGPIVSPLATQFNKTPRGLNIKARGCAYPRYPGYGCIKKINPNGVAHRFTTNTIPVCHWNFIDQFILCNPIGVENSFAFQPGVARVRATPGFDVQPPWGCLTEEEVN